MKGSSRVNVLVQRETKLGVILKRVDVIQWTGGLNKPYMNLFVWNMEIQSLYSPYTIFPFFLVTEECP